MPNTDRKTISTEALLAMGGIQGLLKEASGNRQSIHGGISGPSLALDSNGDIITKANQKDEKPNDSQKTQIEKHKERPEIPQDTVCQGQITAKEESPQKEQTPKEEEQPAKAARPVKGETKTQKSKASVSKGDTHQSQQDAWEESLSLLKEYDHVINRNIDRAIYIEGDLMEVLRSCFGIKACSLVNVIVRRFIEGNKDRLKALRQKQCQLLK